MIRIAPFFYAIGTGVGGIIGPLLFGNLIGSGSKGLVAIAFLIGAAVMALGGVVELFFGVEAAGEQLEDIAKPLTADGADSDGGGHIGGGAGAEPARAAEHRAAAHDQLALAAAGDDRGRERAEVEQLLAELAETAALAHDERAAAHDELVDADAENEPHLELAARERARAAEERARAHDQDAEARSAASGEHTDKHRSLAAAALERARSREQKALAARLRAERESNPDGPSDAERAQADMHDLWAAVHAENAKAHEAHAEHDDAGETGASAAADILREQARAAEERIEAAEHRANAKDARRDGVDANESARREAADVARRDSEERAHARIARRLQQERTGYRRYRPGPGRVSGSPGLAVSTPILPQALDNQIQAIENALNEHGAIDRRELAQLVGARYWGPGVFRDALQEAVADGLVRRTSRSTYATAATDGDNSG